MVMPVNFYVLVLNNGKNSTEVKKDKTIEVGRVACIQQSIITSLVATILHVLFISFVSAWKEMDFVF